MPIHDWTIVRAGTFHNFHFRWTAAITDRLNAGLLPRRFFGMAEWGEDGPEPDFVLPVPDEKERYARKANRITIRHELGDVVAVIEIVSPGNKENRHAIRAFVEKAGELIRQGVNLLVIDLFPPGPRDPQGIHQLIWDEITDQPFELPPNKRLTLAAYQTAPKRIAYVEPGAVGDRLPDMPLFLYGEHCVNVPLEETYQTTWNVLPAELQQLLQPPASS
jgi:hypothetical protein